MRGQTTDVCPVILACGVLAALLVVPALLEAQHGHPLKGQWSGQAGTDAASVRLLFDLDWDGKVVTGIINPGTPTEARVRNVTIDYSRVTEWFVRLDAEGKSPSGATVQVRLEGPLQNLRAVHRVLSGTWTQEGRRIPFSVTRN